MNMEKGGNYPEKLEKENLNLIWLLNNWNPRICRSLTIPNNRIRDKEGNLSYLSGRQRLEIISVLPVVNVMDNSIHSLSEFMDHD